MKIPHDAFAFYFGVRISEGIVSAVRDEGLGEYRASGAYRDGSAPVLQISAPISPGSLVPISRTTASAPS